MLLIELDRYGFPACVTHFSSQNCSLRLSPSASTSAFSPDPCAWTNEGVWVGVCSPPDSQSAVLFAWSGVFRGFVGEIPPRARARARTDQGAPTSPNRAIEADWEPPQDARAHPPTSPAGRLRMAGDEPEPEPERAPTATCRLMCPAEEFARRRRQGRLHRLELAAGQTADAALAVKEYSRPAAGKAPPRPDELRPPAVLLATARHLLATAGRAEEEQEEQQQQQRRRDGGSPPAGTGPEAEAYAFVADRLRALRLDLLLQRRCGRLGAAALERSLAYLLHAGYRLCALPPARFDAALHRAQVLETFASLRRAYRDDQGGEEDEEEEGGGDPSPAALPRFHALFLLYNLGSPEALWQVLRLPKSTRASSDLSAALEINWAFLEGNFARLFRLARALPYLPSCALHAQLPRVRRAALLAFSHGFSARNCRYPLARLVHLLAMDGGEEEAAGLCEGHGLTVLEGAVVFQKGSFRDSSPPGPRRCRLLVDSKRGQDSLLDFCESVCS